MVNDRFAALLRHRLAPAGGLLLLTILAYASSFPGSFILDDVVIVQQNALVQNPELSTIFRTDYWHGVENSGLYRPLTILSLACNGLLTGMSAWGFHFVNVLLHAAVVLLLRGVLRAWGVGDLAATAAAAIFAIHPLHVEVVNIVVGRSELLVALFLLAGLLLAHRDDFRTSLLCCFSYLLALLSKEHAVTFLALLPLWDHYHGGIPQLRRRLPLYVGLLAVTVVWLFWRQYGVVNPLPAFSLTEAAAPLAHVPTVTRVLTALELQGLYLAKLLLPFGLQSIYAPHELPLFIPSAMTLRGAVVLAATSGVMALIVVGYRRRSIVAVCALSYLVAFSPTANVFFPIGVSFAERLAYFPSLWFCAALGVLFTTMQQGKRYQRWYWLVGIVCFLFYSAVLQFRSPVYASEIQLWTAEVEQNPQDYLGWQSLAQSLTNQRQLDEADQAFRRMLQLAPEYPGGLRSYSKFLVSLGRYEEALIPASKVYALSASKQDRLAMAFDGLDLAQVLLGCGRCEEALDFLNGAALPLQNSRALEVRSGVLTCLERSEDVVALLTRVAAAALTPELRFHYGLSLFRLGHVSEARAQLEGVVAIRQDAEAWNLLGVICAQQRDWPVAQAAFVRARELAPDRTDYLDNLLRARHEAASIGKNEE